MATKEGAGCTIKGESTIKAELVDAVHSRGAASLKLKKATAQPDGGWRLPGLEATRGDVASWSVAADGSLITKEVILVVRFAWCRFVDCFIHGSGNCGVVVIARKRARHPAHGRRAHVRSAAEAEMASRGRSLARQKASPSPSAWSLAELRVASETPCRGAVPRQGRKPSARRKDPSRGKTPREARQAWRAWSLAKITRRILWALAGRPVVPWFPLCRHCYIIFFEKT